MNTVYNDIPPVIRNKSEESENFSVRGKSARTQVRIAHVSLSIIDNVAVAC